MLIFTLFCFFSEWVNTQRKLNNKGKLRADRKAALEELGFAWRGKATKACSNSCSKKAPASAHNSPHDEDGSEGEKDEEEAATGTNNDNQDTYNQYQLHAHAAPGANYVGQL